MDIISSLLKTGNKTANITVKKLQFIHTVNGDGSKTATVNIVYKLQFLTFINVNTRFLSCGQSCR